VDIRIGIRIPIGGRYNRYGGTTQVSSRGMILFAIVPLMIGLVALSMSVLVSQGAQDAAGWPTTEGTVTNTYIAQHTGSKGAISYSPEVQYQYQVDGFSYTGDRLGVISQSSSYDWALSYLNNYQVGSTVTVHYNPANPADAVLETEVGFMGTGLMIIGIVFILVGALVMVFLVKKWRKG
jgi:hypothetical protein